MNTPTKNTNCLQGLACPKCSNDNMLIITGMSEFEVYDNGTASFGDVAWDNDSHTECPECNFEGALKDFDTTS